jgi:hypothetical protein
MQAIRHRTLRFSAGQVRIAVVILLLGLVGATALGVAVSRPGNRASDSTHQTAVTDLTMLSLDREGADLFPRLAIGAPDITGLALDRDGADVMSNVTTRMDTTTLRLDRNGADTQPPQSDIARDITQLRLDRDGADLP